MKLKLILNIFAHDPLLLFLLVDRSIFYDQPLPRSNSHPVLRNQETRDGTDAIGTETVPLEFHPDEYR